MWNKKWLYQKYVKEKLTCAEIAKICCCHPTTVSYRLQGHKIKLRKQAESLKLRWRKKEYKNRWYKARYPEGKPGPKLISKETLYFEQKNKFEERHTSAMLKKDLIKKYYEEDLGLREIGKIYGLSRQTILNYMVYLKLPRRKKRQKKDEARKSGI